jgi:hypothetical protein
VVAESDTKRQRCGEAVPGDVVVSGLSGQPLSWPGPPGSVWPGAGWRAPPGSPGALWPGSPGALWPGPPGPPSYAR